MLPSVLAAAQGGSGVNALAVIALVAVVGWLVSLLLHPYTFCPACKGAPRRFGAIATRSFRLCGVCGGTGRRLRVGARLWARNRDL